MVEGPEIQGSTILIAPDRRTRYVGGPHQHAQDTRTHDPESQLPGDNSSRKDHLPKALRIAANTLMCSSALLIVPCRRMRDVEEAYRIATYVSYYTWCASFAVVFYTLVRKQQTPLQRKLYISFTTLLALYMIWNTLKNESLVDGLAEFGPAILTASTYIVSVMFEANINIFNVLLE
ncbi:hypothetical protein OQA88_7222 [Cercophora sp. LCS_1]